MGIQKGCCRVKKFIKLIAIGFAAFQLLTAVLGILPGIQQRIVHLFFALLLIFLIDFSEKNTSLLQKIISIAFVFVAIGACAYMYYIEPGTHSRVGITYFADVIFGVAIIIAILEATRRTNGIALPIVCLGFIVYAFVGPYLPGILAHRGFPIDRIISVLFVSSEGIWGTPLGVSATYISLFILFGAFLLGTGAGQFITDCAYAMFGRVRGGPAKVAVVASSLFGSFSGSSIANVVGTGSFTIPLMIRTGFSRQFSGAVEAVASSGGQFMPPVMAAVGFVMAEILGIPYSQVIIHAIIPAILFYLAIFIMIDLRAAKTGLVGLKKEELPSFKQLMLKKGYLVLPLVVLIITLVVFRYTAIRAGILSIGCTILVSFFNKETRLGFIKFFKVMEDGARGILPVASACASIGIIIGIVMLTGLGFRLSGAILAIAGGHLPVILVLTMICSIILGMGVPTLAAYLILVVVLVPALGEMNVLPIATHLFIFYFGILSNITPPVALAAYAAAGISGANPMKTGLTAIKLGIAGFIIPFMFIYNPNLLLIGTPGGIIWSIITATIGIAGVAAAVEGYIFCKMKAVERVGVFIGALFLISGEITTDFIGFVILAMSLIYQFYQKRTISGTTESA
jgi:TRAP transporter 4TM/12TM fusion protein